MISKKEKSLPHEIFRTAIAYTNSVIKNFLKQFDRRHKILFNICMEMVINVSTDNEKGRNLDFRRFTIGKVKSLRDVSCINFL